MEFTIKDLDRFFETIDKVHDTFVGIHDELINMNKLITEISDGHKFDRERIAKSLETIAEESVAENETL